MKAQITTPIINANFGVEADLEANYFDKNIQNGNDDWFNRSPATYTGQGVIDTAGAAAMIARYAIDPAFRQLPFYRTMSVPAYSIVNNRMWIDAVFTRDYHGNDSTIFASGASKNGMSPALWSCPVAQSVPDKNEILDMMVHVRRAGPNITDQLWMFGGLSIENTTGDRYFDFEMYQTDIYYDRPSLKFYGYGPDAGHTSWKFDASGNITTPGDIIFSANYGSSTLTSIEARIWVDRSALSITPTAFSWSGSFDGESNGSQFGYAGILPKSAGDFYTGTENSKRTTWAGHFQLITGDNLVATNYTSGQFMEFGVNLTKLGLDPVTLLGGNNCGMPFRRVLVKTRSSTSFTAALKDFVGPFDFFLAPRVKVQSDISSKCGLMTIGQIDITNPVSTSTYTWSTTDGHIASYNPDNSIIVDSVGTYVVTQRLQSGCSAYASDTIVVTRNALCYVLQNSINDFAGKVYNNRVLLNWSTASSQEVKYFEIEKSTDGLSFASLKIIKKQFSSNNIIAYHSTDDVNTSDDDFVYYRLKTVGENGQVTYTKVVRLFIGEKERGTVSISPNPVRDVMRLNISSSTDETILVSIYDFAGRQMKTVHSEIRKGKSSLKISDFQSWPAGIYSVKVLLGNNVFIKKMVLTK
ncbi:MAG TPA: T9SS type A sorting domain-containing protein [Hanamia sp.]|nr:T9SS type A sorting domain-containing protein [Hanamia sp.]